MEIKDYQNNILNDLDFFLKELATIKDEQFDYYNFQIKKNKTPIHPEKSDYCSQAWENLKSKIPVKTIEYKNRSDGIKRKIPNICFKVPTGGGKTYLALHSIKFINQDYFKKNNGFILWLVPSESIYSQTLINLRNKEHAYRQVVDRVSGGKTIILEKTDSFTKEDVEKNLCIMILMMQSSNRKTKEFLKLFRDSSSHTSFFPIEDDYLANKKLIDEITNLDVGDLTDLNNIDVVKGLNIKHSVGNVFKLIRPIVIIDEGHRAKSNLATETINNFNPSFILELSATPSNLSNVISEISGVSLKNEEMIKLPINLRTYEESNWKNTLNHSVKKIRELNKSAEKLYKINNTYIRPILLIKVETKKQQSTYNHVEDVKKYLLQNLNINEDEIKIKLSEINEISNLNLLSKTSNVKYIITKDALKEGWDCPFAYVLAILSKTKNQTSLTQFVGRILRQPYAQRYKIKELNESYVYCNSVDVGEAILGVKKGLEEEGLNDIDDNINLINGEANIKKRVVQKLSNEYKKSIIIPKLTVNYYNKVREFDYYRDILPDIKIDNYSFKNFNELNLSNHNPEDSFIKIDLKSDIKGKSDFDFFSQKTLQDKNIDKDFEISLMASQLIDKVHNPWQASRIIYEVINNLKVNYINEETINKNSVFIVNVIKNDFYKWFLKESEKIFRKKIEKKIINFKLLEKKFYKFNWTLVENLTTLKNHDEYPLNFNKNIYQPQYKSNYNNYEYLVASYINKSKAIKWWHRLSVNNEDYSIKGWRANKIYPDFLLKMNNNNKSKIFFIETKGNFLKNDDTLYKEKLFDLINKCFFENIENIENIGHLKVKGKEQVVFKLLFQDEWEKDIRKILG